MIDFYEGLSHHTGLIYEEGGGIALHRPLSGNMNELFTYIPTITGTAMTQVRKIHLKNNGMYIATGVRVWTELPTGIIGMSIGMEYTGDQTVVTPLDSPTSVTFGPYSGAYASGFNIGTLYPGYSTGLWLRQEYRTVTGSCIYFTDRVYVGWKE